MNPFAKNDQLVKKPNRNSFDLSFQSNLTMDLGYLYPCFCKPCFPGDTFKLRAAFGIRAFPLKFPIQTKLRADIHFFKVRSRNLWTPFQDFIGNNDADSVLPYLSKEQLQQQLSTGSLGDYLGLPTTTFGQTDIDDRYYIRQDFQPKLDTGLPSSYVSQSVLDSLSDDSPTAISGIVIYGNNSSPHSVALNAVTRQYISASVVPTRFEIQNGSGVILYVNFTATVGGVLKNVLYSIQPASTLVLSRSILLANGISLADITPDDPFTVSIYYLHSVIFTSDDGVRYNTYGVRSNPSEFLSVGNIQSILSDYPKISSLPFRAYESIYNSFYRDNRNNPNYVNGKLSPNVYVPNKDSSGSDSYPYSLRRRNWEQDFLTSSLPSPQQGAAPLVAVSSSGVASFSLENGTTYNLKLNTADDGDTITGATYSENIPSAVAQTLQNISGFSINDFRQVNSLQRWLESNYRKGLKYRDQIESHFGVTPDYSELDMPEFLGGFTAYGTIDQINQTVEQSDSSPLGSYAGQVSFVSNANHFIEHYCDEHGYIIGIISLVPVPAYQDLLPKFFLYRDTLDYYFPEFGHIGFQPVKYKEICPNLCLSQPIFGGSSKLEQTFGYQRPWYDLLRSTDEVHGDFRLSLRDFVLSRQFVSPPVLSESFLTVDRNQLNNVFAVDDDSDKYLGQIHFECYAKRPIPKYGVPRLE